MSLAAPSSSRLACAQQQQCTGLLRRPSALPPQWRQQQQRRQQQRQRRAAMPLRADAEAQPDSDAAKRLADADRRAAAAAARARADPDVLAAVDAVLEAAPPSDCVYIMRLLCHAVDAQQVAQENREGINDVFFSDLKTLLQSPAFKQATDPQASGNSKVAAQVVNVFDSAWKAAMEVRQAGGE